MFEVDLVRHASTIGFGGFLIDLRGFYLDLVLINLLTKPYGPFL